MKSYKLSTQAQNDLDGIWTYISEQSKNSEAADCLEDKFHDAFLRIADMPGMGRRYVGETYYDGIRFLNVEKYVISYRERDGQVEIVSVLHGSRNLEKILGARLSHGDPSP